MTRQELFTWIRQQYGTEPEYLWHDWNVVLRHNDNNKWYGVVLEISADKLGLQMCIRDREFRAVVKLSMFVNSCYSSCTFSLPIFESVS